jgi:hypothetical protein
VNEHSKALGPNLLSGDADAEAESFADYAQSKALLLPAKLRPFK